MTLSSLFVHGIIEDVIALNNDSFVDVCTIFPYVVTSNNRGGDRAGTFGTPILNVPCRLDDTMTSLLPQREKDNIDIQSVQRDMYVPVGTIVNIKDEIETNAGQTNGAVVRYRVLDVVMETDETDVGLLLEVIK